MAQNLFLDLVIIVLFTTTPLSTLHFELAPYTESLVGPIKRSPSLHSPFFPAYTPCHPALENPPLPLLHLGAPILDAGYFFMETECLPIVAMCPVYKTRVLYGYKGGWMSGDTHASHSI